MAPDSWSEQPTVLRRNRPPGWCACRYPTRYSPRKGCYEIPTDPRQALLARRHLGPGHHDRPAHRAGAAGRLRPAGRGRTMVTRRTLLRIVFPGVPAVMVERYEAADSARPLHCVTYGRRIADGLGREDATRE